MLKSPAKIHRVHKFIHNNKLCIADLDRFRLIEINRVAWDVINLNAMQHINTSPFFLINGDVLLENFSLREMLKCFDQKMMGLLLSVRVDDIRPYGEIVSDSDGRVQAFREKQPICRAGYINGGVYLFNRTVIDAFPKHREHFSIEREVFPYLSNLYALKTEASWIDIGVPERLAYARQHFQNGACR